MTKEEMKEELAECEMRYEDEKRKILRKYAIDNNPYKQGDIICGHDTIIKIESMKIALYSYSGPQMVYKGTQLNKDLSVSKKQNNTEIYQMDAKLIPTCND